MSTRDLLERRRSPGRLVGIVAGLVALALGAAAALALWLLPPRLADTPRERFAAETPVAVQDGTTSASVSVGAGWLALGVGPFLAPDAQTLVSPDDAYRVTLTLLPPASASSGTTGSDRVEALLVNAELETAIAEAVSEAEWSTETMPSGVRVDHTRVTEHGSTTTVAFVTSPDATIRSALALVATTATVSADRYRTTTADLVSSATFTDGGRP